uniref:Uncharacterized protein n=1 Tax=Leersia perrieri TaxID=77586 RepID=A0A0D9XGL0_9ORYZ
MTPIDAGVYGDTGNMSLSLTGATMLRHPPWLLRRTGAGECTHADSGVHGGAGNIYEPQPHRATMAAPQLSAGIFPYHHQACAHPTVSSGDVLRLAVEATPVWVAPPNLITSWHRPP